MTAVTALFAVWLSVRRQRINIGSVIVRLRNLDRSSPMELPMTPGNRSLQPLANA